MKRATFSPDIQPIVERMSTDAEQGAAAAGESPRTFLEPLSIGDFGDIINSRGDMVVDTFGSNVEHLGQGATAEYMRRLVACFNACAGYSTEDLENRETVMVYVGGRWVSPRPWAVQA